MYRRGRCDERAAARRRLARARAAAAPSVGGPVFAPQPPQQSPQPQQPQPQQPPVYASRFSSQGRRPYNPLGASVPAPQQQPYPQPPQAAPAAPSPHLAAAPMQRKTSGPPPPELSAVDAIGSGGLGFRGTVAPRVTAVLGTGRSNFCVLFKYVVQ